MFRCHLFCSYKVSVIYFLFFVVLIGLKKKNIRNYITLNIDSITMDKDRYMATIHSHPYIKIPSKPTLPSINGIVSACIPLSDSKPICSHIGHKPRRAIRELAVRN